MSLFLLLFKISVQCRSKLLKTLILFHTVVERILLTFQKRVAICEIGSQIVDYHCTMPESVIYFKLLILFTFPFFSISFLLFFVLDVAQNYVTGVGDEFVIIGNDVLMKCAVPSFAVDFVILTGWVISEDIEIVADSNQNGN